MKIICNKVCASALQTKRLINNNLKLPQDNESPSRERNTSLQGLLRRTFALLPTSIIKQSITFAVFPFTSFPFCVCSKPPCPPRKEQRKREGENKRGVEESGMHTRQLCKDPTESSLHCYLVLSSPYSDIIYEETDAESSSYSTQIIHSGRGRTQSQPLLFLTAMPRSFLINIGVYSSSKTLFSSQEKLSFGRIS